MRLILSILTLAFVSNVHAEMMPEDWEIKDGKLTYHVKFPLKRFDGTSRAVKGKGHCGAGLCRFLVAVPVKTFDSGDGNRDNHMLEVTKAATNPMISVNVTFLDKSATGPIDAKAEVHFAGKTHVYEHLNVQTEIKPGEAVTRGTIPLALSDFDVERPSLLGVSIDDTAPVDFELKWAGTK